MISKASCGSERFEGYRTLGKWQIMTIPFALGNLIIWCYLFFHLQGSGWESQQPCNSNLLTQKLNLQLGFSAENLEERFRKAAPSQHAKYIRENFVDWEDITMTGAQKLAADWEDSSDKSWWKRPGYHFAFPEEDPQYPFQRITFVDGADTGAMMVVAPFYYLNYYRSESARALFWRLKAKGHIMIGTMSYQEFPGQVLNPFDDRHTTLQDDAIYLAIDAWLHCTRQPEKILPHNAPWINLSESDFSDPDRDDGGGTLVPDNTISKKYDVVLSNQGGNWNDFARNWTVARSALKQLTTKLNMTVLLLGRHLTEDNEPDLCSLQRQGKIEVRPPGRPWKDFLKELQEGRILFVPNIHDASPRVVTEALSLDMPVVMNFNIVGGWKYIQKETGEFFTDSEDVVDAFARLSKPERAKELQPRAWIKKNSGKWLASYKLQAFLEAAVGKERLGAVQDSLKAFKLSAKQETERELRKQSDFLKFGKT